MELIQSFVVSGPGAGAGVRKAVIEKLGGVLHEFIAGCQWAGSGRSEERSDGVVGVAKVLSSISEGAFDSGSDKACPDY